MCRRCGFGLTCRPKCLSLSCVRNPNRANSLALLMDGDVFELEILPPVEAVSPVHDPLVQEAVVPLCGPLCGLERPGGHDLDDSQADLHE